MPSDTKPLWLLTGMLLVLFPVVNFIYWPEILSSGTLPPDGDSIGIPMYGSIVATVVASPIVMGVAWLCLRHYSPKTRLFAVRWDRPVRTVTATLLFGGTALLLTIGAIIDLSHAWPWYEYLWAGYGIACVPWLLAMRAAVIDQVSATAD